MNRFADLIHGLTKGGIWLGGACLIFGMLLLVSNIFGRFTHFVIPGSYELFELVMAVPIAFALVHAALQKAHVIVRLLVSRFPPKLGALMEVFASFLSLVVWALIVWGGARLAFESGLKEASETISVPYLPFRILWLLGLVLFCLSYLLDMSRALKRLLEK